MNNVKKTKKERIMALFKSKTILDSSEDDSNLFHDDSDDNDFDDDDQNNNININNNQEDFIQTIDSFDELWESVERSITILAKVDPNFSSRKINMIDKSNVLKTLNNTRSCSKGIKRKILATTTTKTIDNELSIKHTKRSKTKNRKPTKRLDKKGCCPTCGITQTKQWRYDENSNRWLCNACGLLLTKSKQGGNSFEKRIERRVAKMKRKKLPEVNN